MTPIINRFLEQLVLPPGAFLTGLCVVWWMLHRPAHLAAEIRMRRAGRAVVVLGVLAWLAMLPIVADRFAESRHPPRETALTRAALAGSDAEAIVVFGCGRYPKAPEYDEEDTLTPSGLARARYAARLHRLTGLPLLLAGGRPYGESRSEAAIMGEVLEREFQVPVAWLDEKSRDTRENAIEAVAILKAHGITRILLVVHNRDMPRALEAIDRASGGMIRVTPAPILFRPGTASSFAWDAASLWPWIPNADALSLLGTEMHEWLGGIWYRLRGG
ncbi:MAG: YdcF family protein [Magnetococcales bacterium]|nr:YdcF family protein [Magnetococcales bacterium]